MGLITVLYNCNFEPLITNLIFKNFRFAQYGFIPRGILSLTSSSIELVSFVMDPKYLYCLTCPVRIMSTKNRTLNLPPCSAVLQAIRPPRGADWIHVAYDRGKCRAAVKTVMNIRVP